jgi:flagellar protein FlaG
MKVDSMDASSVSYSKPQEINISSKDPSTNTNDTKINTKETKNSTNDDKSAFSLDTVTLSQLTQQEKKEMPTSEKIVIDAIQKANKAISGGNRRFEFSIHSKTKEIMVKVIDSDTGDVIREIPSEKTLDMVAKLWEMAGIAVDERR